MYTRFYNLKTKPFDITPDPEFLYLTESHREAYASMLYGIQERKGIIAITGEVGTGKTTLIYSLLQNISKKVNTVFIYHTNISFEQLLKTVLIELNISFQKTDKISMLRCFNDYLLDRYHAGEITAIIVDEAQNLQDTVLEDLRMLSNLETSHSKLFQLVLVGQPELNAKLNSVHLRQLKQRISIRQHMKPLSHRESKDYIRHRLRIAGGSLKIFDNKAIDRICAQANGIPRMINVICDNALLIGYSKSSKKIGIKIVDEVISDMEGFIPSRDDRQNPSDISTHPPVPTTKPFYVTTALPLCMFLMILMIAGTKIYLQHNSFNRNIPNDANNQTIPTVAHTDNRLTEPTEQSHLTPSAPVLNSIEPKNGNTADLKENPNATPGIPRFPDNHVPTRPDSFTKTVSDPDKAHLQISNTDTPPRKSKQNIRSDSTDEISPSGVNHLKIKDTATAISGTTIFKLTRQYYHSDHITHAYLIKKANPDIKSIHRINLDQHIIIPEINIETPLIKSQDNSYKIELGTFKSLKKVRKYFEEPVLADKQLKIIPVKVSSKDIWYRLILERFETKEEGLSTVYILKDKNLLPCFNNTISNNINS